MRGFRIDIETDSTMLTDQQEEQERRVEFLQAAGGFLESAMPVAQQMPPLMPLVGEMMMFGVRGFRAGRNLESAFEEAVDSLKQASSQPQPNPEAEAAQAKSQAESQAMQQKSQMDAQSQQMKMAVDQQKAQAAIRAVEAKAHAAVQEAETKAQLTQMELEAKIMKMEMDHQALEQKYELERRSALVKVATANAMPEKGAKQ